MQYHLVGQSPDPQSDDPVFQNVIHYRTVSVKGITLQRAAKPYRNPRRSNLRHIYIADCALFL